MLVDVVVGKERLYAEARRDAEMLRRQLDQLQARAQPPDTALAPPPPPQHPDQPTDGSQPLVRVLSRPRFSAAHAPITSPPPLPLEPLPAPVTPRESVRG
jgi:hypothetical protein